MSALLIVVSNDKIVLSETIGFDKQQRVALPSMLETKAFR